MEYLKQKYSPPVKELMAESPLKNKRIMIVEDDVTNMAVYSVAFRRSGAAIIQDHFNTNTIDMMKTLLPIDVVLLDLMLRHDRTGYDIFRKMKDDLDLRDIPVLIVSAADPSTEIPKAKRLGVNGFISKPIDPFKLVKQVEACINGEEIWYTYDGRTDRF